MEQPGLKDDMGLCQHCNPPRPSDELRMTDEYTGRPQWGDTDYNRAPAPCSEPRRIATVNNLNGISSWSNDDDEEEDTYSYDHENAKRLGKEYRALLPPRGTKFWTKTSDAEELPTTTVSPEPEWI